MYAWKSTFDDFSNPFALFALGLVLIVVDVEFAKVLLYPKGLGIG